MKKLKIKDSNIEIEINEKTQGIISVILMFIVPILAIYILFFSENIIENDVPTNPKYQELLNNIPDYDGENYVIINNNKPFFTEEEKTLSSFEYYSDLDELGRAGVAFANISIETMPDGSRPSLGSLKPSGWKTVKYDIVSGKYLYNRCHLIGFQLTGEGANSQNIITCTRQMNISGMISFENKVRDYVENTNNHVLYRVTPFFEDDNLLASGIEIEAYSVEDDGKGIEFNVFVFNVQDGIDINYQNGDSKLSD